MLIKFVIFSLTFVVISIKLDFMRVAIIYPPITKNGRYPLLGQNRQFKFTNSPEIRIYPIVPAITATLLKQNGIDVLYLDGINSRMSREEFESVLTSFNPDVVMMESKAPLIRTHWEYSKSLKKNKQDIIIVLVGDHISAFPEESISQPDIDYCLCGGDYDVSFLQLVKYLQGKGELPAGTYYKENGSIKNTGDFKLIDNLDELPFIDRELTNWQIYGEAYLYHPCTYIMTGRGCGRKDGGVGVCTFCSWQHNLWHCSARLRSPKNVVDEIKFLIEKYKVREIFDDNDGGAVYDYDWLKEFHDLMKSERLIGKVFISTNARADSLTSQTCELLKKTGFRLLKVGLETGCNKILDKLNKKERIEQIKEGIKNAKDHGLVVLITSMVGYPWETEEDVKETYLSAKELMLYKTHFGDSLQSSVVVPYPGTPLHKEAIKNGWLLHSKDAYEKYDMSQAILKTNINTDYWCGKMWKIHLEPMFLLKSFLTLRRFEDIKTALRGVKSLIGHVKDYKK